MPSYRLFTLDQFARSILSVEELEAPHDLAAVEIAKARIMESPLELWRGIHRVTLLQPRLRAKKVVGNLSDL